MRLSKLVLNGFKSFADRTEFTFDEPVTGIVGPNGCGKSNVVDAIKWVLGERSSKSLRGKEMIDVIFAGSAARKPMGLAAVTLCFENPVIAADVPAADGSLGVDPAEPAARPAESSGPEERPTDEEHAEIVVDREAARRSGRRRALPVDADVVDVERRLYRDGTSQYLINGKRCRLRDIRELFLDTGIGADAYSIIEQGKVDAMLLASPQERRTIFEEAAGVAKYKARRVEAQRKLERAEANLVRTREQLQSTERRLRIVRGQAAKARQFRALDTEHRALKTAVAFDQYDDLRQRLDGLTSQLASLEATRHAAHEALTGAEAEKQEAELQRAETIADLRRAEQAHQAAVHAIAASEQRRDMTQRALAEAETQLAADGSQAAAAEARIADLVAGLARVGDQIAALAEQVSDAEIALGGLSQTRSASQNRVAELRAQHAEKRAAAANIDRERAAVLAHLHSDQSRAASMREQLAALAGKAASNKTEKQTLEESIAVAGQTISQTRARILGFETEITSSTESAERLGADRRGRAAKLNEMEQLWVRMDSRRATLRELEESHAGFGLAVRHVVEHRRAGTGFGTVIGVLADLIETDASHAPMVEASLGATLQALLVPTLQDLPTDEELRRLPGRATFLPVAASAGCAPPTASLPPDFAPLLDAASARIEPLRSAVRPRTPDAALDAVLDRVFHATFLVENLESAMLLAAGPLLGLGARFVTRDGRVLLPDGRVTAGAMNSGAEADDALSAAGGGILQRHSELSLLERELVSLSATLDTERTSLAAADEEAAQLNTRLSGLRASLAAEQRRLVNDEATSDRLQRDLARLDRERTGLAEEIARLTERCEALEHERLALQESAARLQRLHEEQSELARGFDEQIAAGQAEADALGERLAAARVEAGRAAEQLAAARREKNRLDASQDDACRQHRHLAQQVEQRRAVIENHRGVLEQTAAALEQGRAESETAAVAAQELEARHRQIESLTGALADRVSEARRHASHVERDWQSVEISRREVEVKRETLEERSTQDLGLDLAREYPEYREMMTHDEPGSPPVRRIDQDGAARTIETLRAAIKELGNVNLDAIEEESQLAERNEELVRQVADLDDARASLTELIEQLNVASRKRFQDTFERIQQHFSAPDGMFRQLFGGGRAEVRLMPLVREVNGEKIQTDEIDWLESGVEVIAKPPGKEPRSINQLSGGEKTMTAVALLMSIFRSKPSCFCVLDEVDAALDDSNVDRFCHTVQRFLDQSHFIIITHHKRTMQAADRLYGITQQERGVSKRVAVRLEQVGKDGHIRDGQTPSPAAEIESEPEADTAPRPSGALRRALAGMREPQSEPAGA